MIEKQLFGKLGNGTDIFEYRLKNKQGSEVRLITLGATITYLGVPNKFGVIENVVLNLDSPEYYYTHGCHFGTIVGRFANRIANGKIEIDNQVYHLGQNEGDKHFHGGKNGFHLQIWEVASFTDSDEPSITFKHTSPDLHDGYPGEVKVNVTYTFTNENALEIQYHAETTKKTILNLTSHAYFNLTGDFTKTILDHRLKLDAQQYLEINDNLLPTGEFLDVKESPFDFTNEKAIGKDLFQNHPQFKNTAGYDHCYVLNDKKEFNTIAYLKEPLSGRVMTITTNKPGLQLYTGNFLKDVINPSGGTYQPRTAICLETQHYPDAPNHENFPSSLVTPDKPYNYKTIYTFTTN